MWLKRRNLHRYQKEIAYSSLKRHVIVQSHFVIITSEGGKWKWHCCRNAPSLLGPIYSWTIFCLWISRRNYILTSREKKVNHSWTFDLGLKHMVTLKKNQIPNTSQDISFKQTLANAGINSPTFSNLWNNTYCSPDTAFDWTLPWPPEGKPTLDPFLINIGPNPKQQWDSFSFSFWVLPDLCLLWSVTHPILKTIFTFSNSHLLSILQEAKGPHGWSCGTLPGFSGRLSLPASCQTWNLWKSLLPDHYISTRILLECLYSVL